MVELKNVTFTYDKGNTLTDVSFKAQKGEFIAIIGSNGAGKTTLCKLLNGILKPASGTVTVNGMDTKITKSSILAKHIGYLFQNPDRQICKNTVKEEILFGLELALNDKNLIMDRLNKTISYFGFDPDCNPFSLSRGERQRLALASLIAVEPDILILDEPTTGLDYTECMEIMGIIKGLNNKGTIVIMICHDMEVVLDFADRLIVLSDGRIIADGKTKEIFRMEHVLKEASIIPPQIAQLALRLGAGFEDLFFVEEMTDAINSKINRERCVSNERVS